MFLLAQSRTIENAGYGLVGFGILFLALAWVLFPFIVNGKLNSLIREARSAREETAAASKEANFYLKAISDRLHLGEMKVENAKRPTPTAQRPMEEKTTAEPEVYRID